MRWVCVSDLHIAGPECARQQGFLRFLATLGECDRLYLCGDVFQHWWHWRTPGGLEPLPQYAEVVEALRVFPLAVLPGNHDWRVQEFFGAHGAEGPGKDGVLRTRWNGASVAIAHGDQADRSGGYRALSAVLRGRPFRAMVDAMTPQQAWKFLGQLAGHGDVRENAPLIAAQLEWAGQQPEELVIFGHTHAPSITRLELGKVVVNIGDGVAHRTWVEYDSSSAEPLRIREFAVPLHPRA